MIRHADCQATIFYDPEHNAIANVHCGWRGNVQNIYRATAFEMRKTFSSKPENILVGISPSLGPEKSEFINYRKEFPESFLPYEIKPTYFDLWAISRMQLEASGILPHHIEVASICTKCTLPPAQGIVPHNADWAAASHTRARTMHMRPPALQLALRPVAQWQELSRNLGRN